jgi:phage terminase large subunit-like protein
MISHPPITHIDIGLRIERGEISDPAFHLTLYTTPPEADPWKLATWKLANPALGDFRSLEDVKRLALQAQRMPAAEASFRNLILNQRVDTTAQFIDMRAWSACGEDGIEPSGLKGRACYAGLDLGATRDMTALGWCSPATMANILHYLSVGCPARRCRSALTPTKCRMRCGRSRAIS